MNPYEVLKIAEDADQAAIKTAWRNLAKELHPDTNRDDPDASAKLSEINHAYDLLKTPEKRQQYDQSMKANSHSTQNGGFAGDPSDFMFKHFNDIFQHQRAQKSLNLNVELSLDDIASGKRVTHTITIDNESIDLDFMIPAGVPDNARFNIKKYTNAQGLDVVISATVRTLNQSDMQRLGDDILIIKKISAWDAILGSEVSINGLAGKQYTLKIPAGTQPDARLVLRSVGLPIFNSSAIGNIIVLIKVEIPTDLTEEQIATLNEIR